jgi:hypothetical protein
MFLKGMWIYISPCVLAASIQNLIPCEACFIHQQHLAEEGWRCYILLQQPFAESFSMPKIQQQLQSLNVLYMEWIQQLIMQHSHLHSLENVMTCKLPGIRSKGLFYGTQNIFHTGIPMTSGSTWSHLATFNLFLTDGIPQ